jgi:PPM family protein phosphatase
VKGRNHLPPALLHLKYVFASLAVSKATSLNVVLVCYQTAGNPSGRRIRVTVQLRTLLRIQCGARTDIGRIRKNNEDTYQVEPVLNLYVLSDGMGGEAHGEVASSTAVETVIAHCQQAENSRATPIFGEPLPDVSERTNRLNSAIHLANRKVFDMAEANPEQRGMGATIVAAWIEGQRLSLAHVGDSRAYLLRAGSFDQLTADHSLVAEKVRVGILTPQEADASELQSVLTRAVGTSSSVQVDVDEQMLLMGDSLLLCSDGLTRMVTDPEIASTLLTSTTAQEAADRLVELANEYGGVDNISAIVVRVTQKAEGVLDRLKIWKRNSG